MSFTDREYKIWKPNTSFIKFFDDMKKRRIPATDATSARVTNTSPPDTGNDVTPQKEAKKRKKTPSTGYMPFTSDLLVTTAEAQQAKRSKSGRRKTKGSGGKDKKKKKRNSTLERRLRTANI